MSPSTQPLPLTAVILAGGRSSRMGTDKARLPLGSTTLLEHICGVASEVFEQTVIIAANEEQCAGMQLGSARVLLDEPQVRGRGPLAGIYTGLRNARHDAACFLTCDMPFIDGALLRHLGRQRDDDFDVICFRGDAGHHEPFPGIFRQRVLDDVTGKIARSELSLCRLIDHARTRYLDIPEGSELVFTNTNTPQEYQSALSRYALL